MVMDSVIISSDITLSVIIDNGCHGTHHNNTQQDNKQNVTFGIMVELLS